MFMQQNWPEDVSTSLILFDLQKRDMIISFIFAKIVASRVNQIKTTKFQFSQFNALNDSVNSDNVFLKEIYLKIVTQIQNKNDVVLTYSTITRSMKNIFVLKIHFRHVPIKFDSLNLCKNYKKLTFLFFDDYLVHLCNQNMFLN